MKKYYLSIMLLGGVILSSAQQISGNVKDKNGNRISYLEMSAVKDSIRQSTVSDENGNFILKLPENGNYLFKIYRDRSYPKCLFYG